MCFNEDVSNSRGYPRSKCLVALPSFISGIANPPERSFVMKIACWVFAGVKDIIHFETEGGLCWVRCTAIKLEFPSLLASSWKVTQKILITSKIEVKKNWKYKKRLGSTLMLLHENILKQWSKKENNRAVCWQQLLTFQNKPIKKQTKLFKLSCMVPVWFMVWLQNICYPHDISCLPNFAVFSHLILIDNRQ